LLSLISVIAIGGVLVGVSALIVIMGVMNGLQHDLREKILVGSADIQVLPYGSGLRLSDWPAVRDKVRRAKGIEAAAPFVQTQGLVGNMAGFSTGAALVGIESQGTPGSDVTTIRTHAILGDFRFVREGIRLPGAVLGKLLAAKLNAFPGDTVVVVAIGNVSMNASTGAIIPHSDSLVVSGIFETMMYEYDNAYVYVDLKTAQRFAGLGDDVTGIEARTVDRWKAPAIAESLRVAIDAPVRAQDWQEQNRSLFSALKLEKLGMGLILFLIVVVAAFNIVGTLTMIVADKTREIGILRAMGMSSKAVRRIFLLQGILIGAVGTFGGLVLGLLLTTLLERYHLIALDPAIYYIDHLPVKTQPLDVLGVVIASMAIATVATLYPAAQAARMYPVDAIRHD